MIRGLSALIVLLAMAACPALSTAQVAAELDYAVSVRNPVSHIYDVELAVHRVRETGLSLSMPAWEPGVYKIRDFAKNVQDFRAVNGRNQSLAAQQIDKQTWRIAKPAADDIIVRYEVFSNELTDELADLSGAALFMYVPGHRDTPINVKFNMPSGWKIYTALDGKGDRFHAATYDDLIDAPVFAGDAFKVLEFESGKLKHRLVFSKADISIIDEQVTSDIDDILQAATVLFGSDLPKGYTFLIKVTPNSGSSSVAHANSARLTVGENDFVNNVSYRHFLFAIAGSVVRAWNGNRIGPAMLHPPDYTKESNTRLLWMTDGISDYYADLLLIRTSIQDTNDWFFKLSDSINTFEHSPGRKLMSVEDASWNTWDRSDNSDNNTIAYAPRGEIIGLFLDLEIRSRTKNQKSLDDVMRDLRSEYAGKNLGLPEDGFLKAVETVTGSDFHEFFATNVQSHSEPAYNRYLNLAGFQVQIDHQAGTIYAGIELERTEGDQGLVKRTIPGSPAEHARIDAGDILVSLNNERVSFENFRSRLHSHRLGEVLKLTVLRGERLLTLDLTPVEYEEERWSLVEAGRTTPEEIEFRKAWLGSRN